MLSVQKISLSGGTELRGKFQQLSSKLTRLINGRSEGDRQEINSVFDELNALEFKTAFITNTTAAVLLINQCCSIVPSNDTFLVAKGCQLVSNLVNTQDIKVEGKTLAVAVNWIVQSLKYSADIALLDILIALQAILRGNGNYIANDVVLKELMGPNTVFMSFLNPIKGDELKLAMPWEIHLAALQCLESLTFPVAESKQEDEIFSYLESCQQVFLKQFEYDRAEKQDEINYCKILTTSMRGLQNVIQQSSELSSQYLGDLLGVIKAYMLYGLPGHSGLKPERLYTTHVGAGQTDLQASAEKFSRPKANKTVRTRKKRTTQNQKKGNKLSLDDSNEIQDSRPTTNNFRMYTFDNLYNSSDECKAPHPSWLKTSESDFSDTEGGQSAKIRNSQSKVRQCALALMLTVIKMSERKVMFGHWFSFLPSGPATPQTRTLITCLLKDPSPRGRMAVLNIIVALLVGSRNYLLQAEASKKSSASFTPFSISLGYMVEELHRSLCLALLAEHSTPVKMHTLKCIAALVQNTPYHRLDVGLITKIVRNVRGLLKLKDSVIHVAVLTVLGSIASVEYPLPEIAEQLARPVQYKAEQEAIVLPLEENTDDQLDMDLLDAEYLEEYDTSSPPCASTNQISWLLEHCLSILSDPSEANAFDKNRQCQASSSIPVKIESLQVLTVLSRNFFASIVAPHLSAVVKALEFSLTNVDLVIHRHVGHVIGGIGLSIQASLQSTSAVTPITLDAAVNFWQTMLCSSVIAMIQNETDVTLRTVGCDCLASIGSDIFQELKRDKQILIITMLFGCCQDEDHNVRSSSIRALAMCILFPTLREDIHFVMDTAESVIRSLKDELTVVRVKSSWALGNLSDALVLNSRAQMEGIPDSLLLQLLDSSVAASQDNDKIRSNAVRSVGNLLLLYTDELIEKPLFKEMVDKAINSLVRNATSGNNMKVRWNACYAIGNMLKNQVLYQDNSAGLASVFQTLTGLVVNFRNFKVRINAAAALSTPVARTMYGAHFVFIWEGLMKGLDNSQTMEDFSEYKHQDNLINQICLTLIHLMMLVIPEDLSPLLDILLLHLETLQKQMQRFHMRVVPEKEGDLMAAALHAVSLNQLPNLTSEQRSAGTLLVKIFSQDKQL